MFKNRSLVVKVVKDDQPNTESKPAQPPFDYKEFVVVSVAGGLLGAAGWKVIDTTSKIAIRYAETKIK